MEDPKTVLSSDTVEIRYITDFLKNLKSLNVTMEDILKRSEENRNLAILDRNLQKEYEKRRKNERER